jgi:hypothetical protein
LEAFIISINIAVEVLNFDRYQNVYIRDVNVYSNERNAALQSEISE